MNSFASRITNPCSLLFNVSARIAFNGRFTDEELMTVYLFCTIYEECFEHKKMWRFIKKYWGDWFTQLPSCQTFNKPLNRLVPAFEYWINLLSRL